MASKSNTTQVSECVNFTSVSEIPTR